MSLMPMLIGGDFDGDTVVIPEITAEQFSQHSGKDPEVYSGARFGSDGNVYRRQRHNAVWSRVATWLVKGSAGDYQLKRTTTDTLTTDSGSGGDWVAMSSNLDYDVQYLSSSTGSITADVTFEISNDSSTTIAGPRVYSFSASFNAGRPG